MAENTVVYYGTGRRKEAVARVRLIPGTGKFIVNGKDALAYFASTWSTPPSPPSA